MVRRTRAASRVMSLCGGAPEPFALAALGQEAALIQRMPVLLGHTRHLDASAAEAQLAVPHWGLSLEPTAAPSPRQQRWGTQKRLTPFQLPRRMGVQTTALSSECS